jgi:aspartate aminotransferase-like enzyme
MPEREARHRRIAARVREAGSRFGVLADEPFHSPTVTVLMKPEGFEYPAFAKALRKKGFAIGDGYGRLRDRTFRIGHMGYVTDEDAEALVEAMAGLPLSA